MKIKPKTKLGKWSVGLNIIFLIIIVVSVILVLVLGILDFGDKWWDVAVPFAFLIEMAAFITGIMAVRRKDHSILVYSSIIMGILVILFAFLHSLFIND
jgi:hypothetical protein